MVKLREDLVGVVYLNGQAYKAGDTVPEGVAVGGHVTEDGQDYGYLTPEPPTAVIVGSQIPLTEAEATAAVELGLPLDGHEPEFLRGAIEGHRQGVADTLARAAAGSAFDPSEDGNTLDVVNAYLAEHPEEAAAVLAYEARGDARKGILDAYLG